MESRPAKIEAAKEIDTWFDNLAEKRKWKWRKRQQNGESTPGIERMMAPGRRNSANHNKR